MILEMYTLGLDGIKKKGEPTSSLFAQAYQKNWGNFASRKEYHPFNLKMNPDKIERAGYIIEFCKEHDITKVLSIGSGGAVTEIEIKNKLPRVEMVCTDHVGYICDKLGELYDDIEFKVFDMKKDDPRALGNHFDMALFCGSDYVMDNNEYINLLKNFNSMRVKYVCIVTSPYINMNSPMN